MTTIVVRPSNIFGPRDDFEPATSHVTAALVRKVVERHDPIEVWGTGDVVRDVIYIDDMVEGIISAMKKVDSYGAFNIASGNAYTLREILETIIEVDGYEGARIVYDSSKPTTIPIRLIDTAKAEAELGFRARVDLREGLRQTVEWYRKTRGLPRPPAKVRAGG
jgi:GDP-L-fucose synthase